MNDLIRRSDLYNEKPEWLNTLCEGHEEYNKGWNDCNEYWLGIIAEIPTAYDIDGVIADIKRRSNSYVNPFVSYEMVRQCTEVVKRGGIDAKNSNKSSV